MPILAIAPPRRRLEIFRRVEQRLGRDAADVEAGAAERLAALGAGGLEPKLRSADRGDIAARAGADHQDVEIVISHFSCSREVGFRPREYGTSAALPE